MRRRKTIVSRDNRKDAQVTWGTAGTDSGIGGSNVKVATNLIVKAGFNENAIGIIATIRTSTTNIANFFKGRNLVIIEQNPLPDTKTVTIAAINAVISETDPDDVKAIATNAVTAINAATKVEEVNAIKAFALSAIASAKAAYQFWQSEGLGSLGTEQDGPAVEVIDQDDKSVILYNPKKVNFIKVTSNE